MVVKKYYRTGSVYRPVIEWKVVMVSCLIVIIIATITTFVLGEFIIRNNLDEKVNRYLNFVKYIYFLPNEDFRYKLFMFLITLICVIRLKSILIFFVYVYQRFTPESIRSSCRFKPSCSQYMIMALEKYGAIRGTVKGLRRLSRCHAPNGGEDYP